MSANNSSEIVTSFRCVPCSILSASDRNLAQSNWDIDIFLDVFDVRFFAHFPLTSISHRGLRIHQIPCLLASPSCRKKIARSPFLHFLRKHHISINNCSTISISPSFFFCICLHFHDELLLPGHGAPFSFLRAMRFDAFSRPSPMHVHTFSSNSQNFQEPDSPSVARVVTCTSRRAQMQRSLVGQLVLMRLLEDRVVQLLAENEETGNYSHLLPPKKQPSCQSCWVMLWKVCTAQKTVFCLKTSPV